MNVHSLPAGLILLTLAACSPEQPVAPTNSSSGSSAAAVAQAPEPAQALQQTQSTVRGPITGPGAGLPDFTSLVEKQGPAVVNVVATRKARPGAAQLPQMPDDPF